MRGKDEQPLDVCSYLSPEQRIPQGHPGRWPVHSKRHSKLDITEGCPILPRPVRKGGRRDSQPANGLPRLREYHDDHPG